MHTAFPSNPLPAVMLSLMEAVAGFFRAIATDYDIEFRRRERATTRLETIYRIAAGLYVTIQARMPRPLRPIAGRPITARPAPPHPATTPSHPDPAPRRKRRLSARTLAARLVREIDRLANEIESPIPERIRTLLDQVLESLGLTRDTIRERARALRNRLRPHSPAAMHPARTTHAPRPEPPPCQASPPRTPPARTPPARTPPARTPWAHAFQR